MSSSRAFSLDRRRSLGSLGDVADHIDHDTDGFNHPFKIYDLTDSLVRRGNIQAVLGGNFRRLLGDAWVAQPHRTEKQS
jgi:hypothetical protein